MTIEERLVQDRGYTYVPELALWMLRNGKLINGSYEGRQRDIDHREISQYFKPSKFERPGSAYIYVEKFMRRGNIRIGCSECGYTLECDKAPNQDQFNSIQGFMNRAAEKHIPFQISRHTRSGERGRYTIIRNNAYQYIAYIQRYTNLEFTRLKPELFEIY